MTKPPPDDVIILPLGEGRHYPCGPMQSVFLADGKETGDRDSVSIWCVDPGKPGPGAHSHEANDQQGGAQFAPGARLACRSVRYRSYQFVG